MENDLNKIIDNEVDKIIKNELWHDLAISQQEQLKNKQQEIQDLKGARTVLIWLCGFFFWCLILESLILICK